MAGGTAHLLSKFRPTASQRRPRGFNRYKPEWSEDHYLEPKYAKHAKNLTPFYFINVKQYKAFRFPSFSHLAPEKYYYDKNARLANGAGRVRLLNNLKSFKVFGRKPLSLIERDYW